MILSRIHKLRYKTYETIDFLPIWNFKQIQNTGDLRYLIKGIDYEFLPKVYLNLKDTWDKIYNVFIEQSNPEMLYTFKSSIIEIQINQRKFLKILGSLIILAKKDFISTEAKDKLINDIRQLGYNFNDSTEDNYYNSILDLQRQLIGLRKVIDIKDSDNHKKYVDNKQTLDIEEILVMFTSAFPGTVFNSKTLTVKQYLSYLKRYNKIVSDMQPKSVV